jgi:hypothetical protein
MGGQRHEWTGVGLFVDRCSCKQSVRRHFEFLIVIEFNSFVLIFFLVFCKFPSLFSNNFINQQICNIGPNRHPCCTTICVKYLLFFLSLPVCVNYLVINLFYYY